MTSEEYKIAREFLEKKSLHLMEHESKGHAPVAWPASNFEVLEIKGRRLFIVKTNVFRAIVDDVLPQACLVFPDKFGTGNGQDVIDALYDFSPFGDKNDFASLLQSEQFCYVFEMVDGKIDERVLRIDLFRLFKQNENGQFEFIGGLFHALNHFSYNGCPLSTKKSNHEIANPEQLVIDIAINFFLGNFIKISESAFNVVVPYDDKKQILYAFYYEEETGVYFLKTVTQKDIKS